MKRLIKVVLIDIDNTLLSFTGYVKEAMREGFSLFGLKPYTEAMFPVFKESLTHCAEEQNSQASCRVHGTVP